MQNIVKLINVDNFQKCDIKNIDSDSYIVRTNVNRKTMPFKKPLNMFDLFIIVSQM